MILRLKLAEFNEVLITIHNKLKYPQIKIKELSEKKKLLIITKYGIENKIFEIKYFIAYHNGDNREKNR